MSMSLKTHWKEYGTAFCATFIMVAAGNSIGWTSPTLSKLESDGIISPSDTSWITALMMLCSCVSPIPTAILSDVLGRKPCLLFAAVFYTAGWISVIVASTKLPIYLSRVFAGLGYGVIYTVAPVYLGEIATDELRGSLNILITVMNKFGILLQYCIGPFVSVKVLASINLTIPVIFFILFVTMPESPYFHVKKNNTVPAEKCLRRLRVSPEINGEMKKIETTVANDMRGKGKLSDLFQNENWKGLGIVLVLFYTQQFCGSAAVIAYNQDFFSEAQINIKPEYATIIFGVIQLLVAFLSFFLVEKKGRRPLLLASSFIVTFMLALIGTYFFFVDDIEYDWLRILPLILVIVYIVGYAIGLSTVPMAVTSEMFPTNVKSYLSCVCQIFVGLMTAFVQKMYKVISDDYGKPTMFWTLSVCSLIGLIIIYICLPETKGKSFADIQNELHNKRDKKDYESQLQVVSTVS